MLTKYFSGNRAQDGASIRNEDVKEQETFTARFEASTDFIVGIRMR